MGFRSWCITSLCKAVHRKLDFFILKMTWNFEAILDICWRFFRSPNIPQLLLFQHSTFKIINNYFINAPLCLVSGTANESQDVRARAVKPLWYVGNSSESKSTKFTSIVAGLWIESGEEIYLIKKEKQVTIEQLIFQWTENIISGAAFGQIFPSQNEWANKFMNSRPWYSLVFLDRTTSEVLLLDILTSA